MRLDKAVTLAGLSRTEAKKALSQGRVSIDGAAEKNGSRLLRGGETVCLDGQAIDLSEHAHIMMNKPAGVLTATEDPRAATVCDLLPAAVMKKKPGPIGRLDKDVTGLVLLTTDGVLAHRVISPKQDIWKIYTAHVEGRLDETCVKAFEEGIHFRDFDAKPARLEIVRADESGSVCRVHVSEGKFHQVKRMLAAVGHEVTALNRDRIADIVLDPALEPGQWRYLTPEETAGLYAAAGMEEK